MTDHAGMNIESKKGKLTPDQLIARYEEITTETQKANADLEDSRAKIRVDRIRGAMPDFWEAKGVEIDFDNYRYEGKAAWVKGEITAHGETLPVQLTAYRDKERIEVTLPGRISFWLDQRPSSDNLFYMGKNLRRAASEVRALRTEKQERNFVALSDSLKADPLEVSFEELREELAMHEQKRFISEEHYGTLLARTQEAEREANDLWDKRRTAAEEVMGLARHFDSLWKKAVEACGEWAEEQTKRLWKPWSIYEVTYTAESILDALNGEEDYGFEGDSLIRRAWVYDMNVKSGEWTQHGVEGEYIRIGSIIDVREIRFDYVAITREMEHHVSRQAAGFWVNKPPRIRPEEGIEAPPLLPVQYLVNFEPGYKMPDFSALASKEQRSLGNIAAHPVSGESAENAVGRILKKYL